VTRMASLTCAVFGGMALLPSFAQAERGRGSEERFIATVRLPGVEVVRELHHFDPSTGEVVVLDRSGSREFPDVRFMDQQGRHLALRRREAEMPLAGRIELDGQRPGPHRVFAEPEVDRMEPAALSPDGKSIVFFHAPKNLLVIGDDKEIHRVATDWALARPFSWSPDSSQVAFYYAPSSWEDDFNIQQHGVAVLSLNGKLRELVKPSEATATPTNSCAKDVPPGWGRTGEYLYYTGGLKRDDPAWQYDCPTYCHSPTATWRVNIKTGQVERIGMGTFACVSPDEEYVLIYPSPKPAADGKWVIGTTMVRLATRELTYLSDEIVFPRISPSGKLVACFSPEQEIRLFTTSDWRQHGKAIPLPEGVPLESWTTSFRWVVME